MIAAMRKVIVVGGPGSGKTRLAAALARALGVRHVELDALWWLPSWTPVGEREFRDRLAAVVANDGWVVDGHYLDEGAVDIVWSAADTLVWLDIPRRTAIARVLRRSASRALHRTDLWGTNREHLSVLGPRSVVALIRRWPGYAERIAERLASNDLPHLTVVRLRTDREVDDYAGSIR